MATCPPARLPSPRLPAEPRIDVTMVLLAVVVYGGV